MLVDRAVNAGAGVAAVNHIGVSARTDLARAVKILIESKFYIDHSDREARAEREAPTVIDGNVDGYTVAKAIGGIKVANKALWDRLG